MNCTICKRPVDEHGESRETDICVYLKQYPYEKSGSWYKVKVIKEETSFYIQEQGLAKLYVFLKHQVPHYSSPEMSAETWSLVERMPIIEINNFAGDWQIIVYMNDMQFLYDIEAPTPTLAICRAFLAKEEK